MKSNVVLHKRGFSLDWSAKGIGFGQFYFHQKEDGTVEISSETMGKDFIKSVLCEMVDLAKLAD